MIHTDKKLKVVFFTPHADDIELGCPFTYNNALKLGYEVVEVIMTNNAFGTSNYEFKGKRLTRIRTHELKKANQVFEKHAKNKIRVIMVNYCDGYLPLNRESLRKVVNLIKREKPQIIFAPDPWFAQDFHPDHLNTGRLVYFSLKKLGDLKNSMKIFYYFSFRTNYYIQCEWKDFKVVKEGLLRHKSQYSPLKVKLVLAFYSKLSMIRHFLERGKFSESFRQQNFTDGAFLPPKRFNLRDRFTYFIFYKLTLWGYNKLVNLTPKEIGLE